MTAPPYLEPSQITELRKALARFDEHRLGHGVIDAARAVLAEWDRGVAAREQVAQSVVESIDTAHRQFRGVCTCPGAAYPGNPRAVATYCPVHGSLGP